MFEEALQDVINEHTRLIYYDVTAIKVILVLQSVLIFTYFFLLFTDGGRKYFIAG